MTFTLTCPHCTFVAFDQAFRAEPDATCQCPHCQREFDPEAEDDDTATIDGEEEDDRDDAGWWI